MCALATRFTAGVQETIDRHGLAWSVVPLGARTEYRFCAPAPRTGTESAAAEDPDLEAYLHLALLNRGVLITPFHNMALMCPATTEADVDLHTREFARWSTPSWPDVRGASPDRCRDSAGSRATQVSRHPCRAAG